MSLMRKIEFERSESSKLRIMTWLTLVNHIVLRDNASNEYELGDTEMTADWEYAFFNESASDWYEEVGRKEEEQEDGIWEGED